MPRSYMAKKIGEIEIDLKKEVLEGFEGYYNSLNVAVLKEAIRIGQTLPRVDVTRENGLYRLVFGRAKDFGNYGGHSRAVAALQTGDALRCNLYDTHRNGPIPQGSTLYQPIQALRCVRDVHWKSLERVKINLDFLPEEVRTRFLKENGLVLHEGTLMTQENYDNPPPF